MQISVDTKTDSLNSVLATLGAAYGVSLSTSGRAARNSPGASRRTGRAARSPEASKVRAWAKENKIKVSSHGRLPAQLIADYQAAH